MQVQELGLASAYQKDGDLRTLVRKLMALSMVPRTEVGAQFRRLSRQADTPELVSLFAYFDATWLQSRVWTIASWCMDGEAVRTNNDCEVVYIKNIISNFYDYNDKILRTV